MLTYIRQGFQRYLFDGLTRNYSTGWPINDRHIVVRFQSIIKMPLQSKRYPID